MPICLKRLARISIFNGSVCRPGIQEGQITDATKDILNASVIVAYYFPDFTFTIESRLPEHERQVYVSCITHIGYRDGYGNYIGVVATVICHVGEGIDTEEISIGRVGERPI